MRLQVLACLGVDLDTAANDSGGPLISRPRSKVTAYVIRTDEELMIARHTVAFLSVPMRRSGSSGPQMSAVLGFSRCPLWLSTQNGIGHPVSHRRSRRPYQLGEPLIRIAPQH